MYPRYFSELAGALSGQAVLRQAPQGEPGWDLGPVGRSAQGPLLLPDGLCQHQSFFRHIPCCCRLGCWEPCSLPHEPEPCRKGCVPDWGVQLGLKADLGRKPHVLRCPLSSDRPHTAGLCPSWEAQTGFVCGGPSLQRSSRPPRRWGPHQSHPDPRAGLDLLLLSGAVAVRGSSGSRPRRLWPPDPGRLGPVSCLCLFLTP